MVSLTLNFLVLDIIQSSVGTRHLPFILFQQTTWKEYQHLLAL